MKITISITLTFRHNYSHCEATLILLAKTKELRSIYSISTVQSIDIVTL